jgi:F-type H+-transporting ATPase subunit delta
MTNNTVAQAIYLVSKDKTGTELSSSLDKIVKFLVRKRLMSKKDAILESLSKIVNKEEGRVVVYLKSVSKLTEETKKDIAELLKKNYSAKEFKFIESLDEKLLGGVRIEVNNEVIDLSIKNKIGQLQEHLKRA